MKKYIKMSDMYICEIYNTHTQCVCVCVCVSYCFLMPSQLSELSTWLHMNIL